MSGYFYKLIFELNTNYVDYSIEDIAGSINAFLESYLKIIDINVFSTSAQKDDDHLVLTLYDKEFPLMSFNMFYEFEAGALKYINIIDVCSQASDTMFREDFFESLIDWLQKIIVIKQAVLLIDPITESYSQVFDNLELYKNESQIYKYYSFN